MEPRAVNVMKCFPWTLRDTWDQRRRGWPGVDNRRAGAGAGAGAHRVIPSVYVFGDFHERGLPPLGVTKTEHLDPEDEDGAF